MANVGAKSPVRGACLCGAVQYEIDLPTLGAAHCHCTICRRGSGAGYLSWVTVPIDQLRILEGEDRLHRYASSDHAGRSFCTVCGSMLIGDSSRTPDTMYIVRGNLQGDVDHDPQAHICIESRVPWIAIADDLPQLEGAGILTTKVD